MPYRRRTYGGRRRTGRTYRRAGRRVSRALSSAVKATLRSQGFHSQATKYIGYHQYQTTFDGVNGQIYSLVTPTLGSSDSQRIGDTVNLISLRAQLWLACDPSEAQTKARVIIFQWMDSNQYQAPDATQLFTNSSYPWASSFIYDSVKGGIFRVIRDEKVALDAGKGHIQALDMFIGASQLPRSNVQFLGSGPSAKGQIYIAIFSDKIGPPQDALPKFDLTVRTRYTDA